MTRKLLLIAATVLALGLGSTGTAHADAEYRFWQFNMCGQVLSDACPNGGVDDARDGHIVADVRDSIEEFQPAGVSLNEVCYSQYTKLMSELKERNIWEMQGKFITTYDKPYLASGEENKCEPDNFGNAILSRKWILSSAAYPLPTTDGSEPRRMICVRAQFPIQTRLCSVHITRYTSDQGAQIAEVTRVVNQWVAQDGPVVLMGDFNVEPDDVALDPLYDSSHPYGRGYFQEVDEFHEGGSACRCGEATVGESLKYDYIFVSAKHWRSVIGDATYADRSDHDPLRGWAHLIF